MKNVGLISILAILCGFSFGCHVDAYAPKQYTFNVVTSIYSTIDVLPTSIPKTFVQGNTYRFVGEFDKLSVSNTQGVTFIGGSFKQFSLSNCKNIILKRVYVHDAAQDAFLLKSGCTTISLDNCSSYRSYRRGVQIDSGCSYITISYGNFSWAHGDKDADGIAADQVNGLTVTGTICSNNGTNQSVGGDGIQISGNSKNVKLYRCVLHNNGNGGFIEQSSMTYIQDCVSFQNRHGFAASGGSINVVNGLAWANDYGVFIYNEFGATKVTLVGSTFQGNKIKNIESNGNWQ